MKFNHYTRKDIKELLEKEYAQYIKETPMTKKEARALREWVKEGHSVYKNPHDVLMDFLPVVDHFTIPEEFLTIFRLKESHK